MVVAEEGLQVEEVVLEEGEQEGVELLYLHFVDFLNFVFYIQL